MSELRQQYSSAIGNARKMKGRADNMKPDNAMTPRSDSKRKPKVDMTANNSFAIPTVHSAMEEATSHS